MAVKYERVRVCACEGTCECVSAPCVGMVWTAVDTCACTASVLIGEVQSLGASGGVGREGAGMRD